MRKSKGIFPGGGDGLEVLRRWFTRVERAKRRRSGRRLVRLLVLRGNSSVGKGLMGVLFQREEWMGDGGSHWCRRE